ncbi:glycosyltransferase [Microbacterium sp.]|uniref:glycosyltransferase n=1 Tax=Microbacterium sp. TaxID=51671 RepID=UPI003A8A3553
MRIAYVCADPGIPVFGSKGASVHIQEIVRAFRARGDEVTVYTSRLGREVPPDLADLPVVEVPVAAGTVAAEREGAVAAAAAQIARRAVADGCDLVYERFSLFAACAAEVSAQLAVPAVVEVNAPLIDEQRAHRVLVDAARAERIAARALGSADLVACVSAPVAEWARCHGAERVVVAANGVNTDRIRPGTPRVGGPLRVGFVGTLKPWHGVDVLVDAVAGLDGVRLVVIGDGPQGDDLRRRARTEGMDAEFVGAVPPADMPAVLGDLDVGVAPYPADAERYFSPLKVYEYLAAGLPVVASRVGQLPAAVTEGVTGLLVDPGDRGALAGALASLRDAPEARRRMARAAREHAVRRHGWPGVLAGILAQLRTEVPA